MNFPKLTLENVIIVLLITFVVVDVKIPNEVSEFRLIDKKVLEVLKNFKEQDPFIRGVVSWSGFKQEKIIFDRFLSIFADFD